MSTQPHTSRRRWRSALIRGIGVASALLLALVVTLWVVSYFRSATISCTWTQYFPPAPPEGVRKSFGGWEVDSVAGCLRVDVSHDDARPYAGSEPKVGFERVWDNSWDDASGMIMNRAAWGVQFEPYTNAHGFFPPDPHAFDHEWALSVRYWVLTIVSALPLVLFGRNAWRTRRQRRTAAQGLCANCGYDLRASPERCPECGRANDRAFASMTRPPA